jgi:hypothetical protein
MPVPALMGMFASSAHIIRVFGRDRGKDGMTLSWPGICMAASLSPSSIATGYFRELFSTPIAI